MFDCIVIGSGPGGYVAAIRCAQLGMKTALIERYRALGGTCLNVGCIPSKALLDSSEHFYNAKAHFAEHGIKLQKVEADIKQMIERKQSVVNQTVAGIQYLIKKNKIELFTGHASFLSQNKIKVSGTDMAQEIEGRHIIIATGSKPATLPNITLDKKRIITSTEALEMKEIPQKMIIIGGGVIGLELGSVYARLGTKIEVIEFMDTIIPNMDRALGKELEKTLKKTGFEFYYKHKVVSAVVKSKKVIVSAENEKGEVVNFEGDYCLVSVGRKPYTEGLELQNAGVDLDERGRIKVNEKLQTSASHIYAIGDVVAGAMLAHKASEEGVFAAEQISGQHPHINYNLIPGVVYTWPEVAAVGATEEELLQKNIPFKTGVFPFKASGRARASMDTDGMVKILADKQTDEILGVHIIGPRAADMIAEATVAMEFRASAEDIARICHPHPTYSEAIKEAALAAWNNSPIHL